MKINFKISQRTILIFLFLASFFALSLAYISQYFFGLQPCILCLYQRIPFFLIIFLSLVGLFLIKKDFALQRQNLFYQKLIIKIALILLIINTLLALYHVGVEQKIFIFGGCADLSSSIANLEDLKNQLLQTKAIRCDEPQFTLFGISMAGFNAIYCSLISFFTLLFLSRSK